ncbi:fatty acid oxidation complex subunit alpha FadB [Pseudomaricurvus alcaniphilus]|uniref:fatty acid oxidation complex subunit alpha FadB n=1 Tax=Pseudomaricurvus alcaniphilus TaxID=1166482 RepID=UPI001407733E|nr:fatty acid oxidation complex subunit alpha FadB [Pseudomaricurvus alcaniphilus]NHN35806.1 fatty acid oxidation complex subunit alpha FadB [Pseudomaricurvus alcaniphilus]
MEFQGKAIRLSVSGDGIAEMVFDLENDSVNKFNRQTLDELREVTRQLAAADGVRGLLVKSGKPVFIVGADITEFGQNFVLAEADIIASLADINNTFNAIEDLPYPSVSLINGVALGGGFEMALTTDFRVMSEAAIVGFPETQLGIIPGYGGTVRFPRLVGTDNAIEWIASGKRQKAQVALAVGAVDAVVAPELVEPAGRDLLERAIAGDFDWQARKAEKKSPLLLNDIEASMSFETAKGMVAAQAGPHYPAPLTAVKTIQKHAKLSRDEALKVETAAVSKLAKTEVAANLVAMYLGDQQLAKIGKKWAAQSDPVKRAAVLGAGIMGGGIAYQSAVTGTPIIMKDINPAGIELGLGEAAKLLAKRVNRGRMKPEQMAAVLNAIVPSLNYGDFGGLDIVVEAVVENPKVKHAVLAEAEQQIGADTVLASNTSTISIDYLAQPLSRPENFCGMHFFNPVHAMPLVEVIRGSKTSAATVAKTVNYALAMGKKPVVVRDCPGFLVNRILLPYMGAFLQLLHDGADFVQADRVMEKFGWPMGPAYLADVVGIDTGVHASAVMAEGFPDRMQQHFKTGHQLLLENERLGQKNGCGYYRYEMDKRGKPAKRVDPAVYDLLAPHCAPRRQFEDSEILERMMTALCLEAVRCLEDGIVDSANELDLALVYGIGMPPFVGGALKYMDSLGLESFVAQADKYAELGGAYKVTDKLRAMAAAGERFYALPGQA